MSVRLAAIRRAAPGDDQRPAPSLEWQKDRAWLLLPLLERQTRVSEREVTVVEDLWNDIGSTALHLEIQELRLAVFRLVERRKLGGVRLQVRELAVMPHRPHEERLFILQWLVGELESRRELLPLQHDGFSCTLFGLSH